MAVSTEEKSVEPKTAGRGGLPVAPEIMFTDHKGACKERVEKRQKNLVGRLSFLAPFLQEGEVIFLVTRGCSPVSIADQLMTGWIVFYLRRSLFVFTNRRIIQIPTKVDFTYRYTITQILYGDCEQILMKGRTLVVRYRNGRKEKFPYMDGREKKKLKALLKVLPLKGETSRAGKRTHLCPRCSGQLLELVPACPECGLEFLTLAEGRRLSLVYPGGGYFYTRHPWLGISDALAEVYLICITALFTAELLRGDAGMAIPAAVFGTMVFIEKLFTVYHTKNFLKEFIPREKKVHFLVPSASGTGRPPAPESPAAS